MNKQPGIRLSTTALVLALLTAPNPIMPQSAGIISQKAPELGVDQWVALPDGKETIKLADYEGKVVYLFSWQRW